MKILIIAPPVFNQINNQIHQWCIVNIAQYNATKWADELIHPIDGRISLTVDDKVVNAPSSGNHQLLTDLTPYWIKKVEL